MGERSHPMRDTEPDLRPRELWLQAGVGAVMGLAIIALKLVLR
jgi:hypothetical protein